MYIGLRMARIYHSVAADLWARIWMSSLIRPLLGMAPRLRIQSLRKAVFHSMREVTLSGQISAGTQRCMKGE